MIFQYFSWQIYFSRTFQESPLNSSTFQACLNPVVMLELLDLNSMVKFNGKKIWEPHEFFQTFLFSKKFFQNTISVSLQRPSADDSTRHIQ